MNNRIVTIDFVKGLLVLFMVIYHSLNYRGYESLPHDYLLFVPPSFVVIAGFIITHVYVPKYGLTSRKLISRLTLRSCKLLLLFTFLNVGAAVIFSSKYGGINSSLQNFMGNWTEIYILGGSRRAAFEVLLPIGYTLFLAIPALKLQSLSPYAVGGVLAATVAICLVAQVCHYPAYNLYLISAGAVGMAIGLLPGRALNAASRSLIAPVFLYALYWVCFLLFGDKYMIQLFATLIYLYILYAVGNRIDMRRRLSKQVLLLGRYSLLSYIIQILYLQVFMRLPFYSISGLAGTMAVIVLTMLLTWLTILIVDYARGKSDALDGAYRKVFA
jgi:hypothetical protein